MNAGKVHFEKQGDGLRVESGGSITVDNGGAINVSGSPASITTATTPASGTCAVQFAFKDVDGVALPNPISGIGYGSGADGLSVVAVTSHATLINGVIDPLVATKSFHFITDATGQLGVTVTAQAGTYYITFQMPNGKLLTSSAIVVN